MTAQCTIFSQVIIKLSLIQVFQHRSSPSVIQANI